MSSNRSVGNHRRKGNFSSRTPNKNKSSWKRSVWMFLILFILIVTGAGCGFIGASMSNLPDVANVKPAASSQIYDVNGNLITTVHSSENRLPVKLTQVPKHLQNAFIATEDARFFSHHGLDPIGILRAIWVNISRDGVAEGGSTITQQLARNAFLSQDRTLKRKVMEAFLALRIEQHYTKQEILELYMNQIYFGQGAYGVQAASHVYFGKNVQDLSLAQAALLAGLPQSPNYFSPFNNLKAAKDRQAIVLNQMAKYGYIDQATADEAKEADLELKEKLETPHIANDASYFIDYIISLVTDKYGDDAIYKEGYKIYTTIDMKAQAAAVRAMQELPTYYTDENGLQQPQGALVAINPHNGYIVAMIGGRGNDYFNRAVLAQRQPGSAFKPFVYLAALTQGMTPGTIFEDKETTFHGWTPRNYSRHHSGSITMRYAVTHSNNIAAVLAADKVGMSNVLNLADRMGVKTLARSGAHNDENLAVALGGLTNGVTVMDMAAAYAVLANNGTKVKPVAITKILDRNGQVVEENELEEEQIVEGKYAYAMTSMLESVVQNGTGRNAYIGRPAAGKTGTTDEEKDAWFVGYTPDLVAAVWMGDDSGSESLHGTTGGTTPAIIWGEFMRNALVDVPPSEFPVPAGGAALASEGYYNPAPPKAEKKKDDKDDKKDKSDKKEDSDSSADTGKDSDSKEEEKPTKSEASSKSKE